MANKSFVVFVLLAVTCVGLQDNSIHAADNQSTGLAPTTQVAEESIALSFPPNMELKVLIRYVGERLGINFIYDEQAVSDHITIVSPVRISKDSLLGLLESALRIKGLVIIDGDQPGWKKILPASNLAAVASTRPAGEEPAIAVTQVFELKYADPQRVDAVIKPFLTQPGGNSIVVAEQHLLIATDYASTMSRLAGLVQLLDQKPADIATEFIPIRNLDVSDLVSLLQQILTARDKAQSVNSAAIATSVEVLSDPRTNQLILIGPPAKVALAAPLAGSLDVPLPLETHVYVLKNLSPDRLDKLVKELLDPLDAKRLYQSAADKDSGLLIATTTPAIHERIAALKDQMDVPITQEASPIRFYKLTNTTAADVLATIRTLEGSDESPGPEPAAAATPAGPLAASGSQSAVTNANPTYPGMTPLNGAGLSQGLGASASSPSGAVPPINTVAPVVPIVGVHTARGTITADPNTNTIIVEADPATQKIYEGLIKMLDKRRPQVLIECTLVTLDTSDNFSLGVELGADSKGTPKVITFNSFGLSTPDATTGALTITPEAGFNGTLLGSGVAQVVIQALQTNSRSKVLSAPRILVNDNATGALSSVSEQPYTSQNATTTVSTTTFAGYATAGTTITLTPHISEGDHLQLEYVVTLNNFSGSSSNGIPPPRQTDSVQSKITIPDGSTIVVGGLNSSNLSDTRQTIPFLGSIPIIKELVSQQNRDRGTSTLFVFIRPVILRDDQFADLQYFSQRDMAAAGLPGDFPRSQPLLIR